jgi:capsular exopolysaccharide synthesis family protein
MSSSSSKTSSRRRTQDKGAAPGMSLDYQYLIQLCLRHWIWPVSGLIVGAVIGLISSLFQTPVYQAKSTLEVLSEKTQVSGVADVSGVNESNEDMLKTKEQLLETHDLSDRVVRNLQLNTNSDFLPRGKSSVSEDEASAMVADDTSIRIRMGTRLIDIFVEHPSPTMAKQLADELAKESINLQADQLAQLAVTDSANLIKQVADAQAKVEASEHALHDYEAQHMQGSVNPTDSNVDLADSELKDLETQRNTAEAQVLLLEERYGPNHPKLIQAKATLQQTEEEIRKAQQNSIAASGSSIGYDTLKSEVEAAKLEYNNLQTALNQVQVAQRPTNSDLVVGSLSDLPLAPVRPSKTKATGIGGFLGFAAGMAFILGLYFIDKSVRSVSQAEEAFGESVIAAVPILTELDGKTTLPTYSDPQSFVAEAFRGLRASLILQDRESPTRSIVVCSSIPGEGKSFCSANLAVVFAQAGLKTLLIDCDLRLPTLHTYFNLQAEGVPGGFQDVLTGKASLAAAALKSPIPNLDLLTAMIAAPNPAELLSGERFTELLAEAGKKYDRVVIDSAPLNAVSDTMLVMPQVDTILLVVRASQTPMSETKAALQKIYGGKMKPLGLILNYISPNSLKSYAYGYSYGQNSYAQRPT